MKESTLSSPLESLQLGSSGSLKDRTKKDGERMEERGRLLERKRGGEERKNRREPRK